MPIGHDERRCAAEDAAADRADQQEQILREMAAKGVPYALNEINRMRRDALAAAVDFGMANPLDTEMREALNKVDAAYLELVGLIQDRVRARQAVRDMNAKGRRRPGKEKHNA